MPITLQEQGQLIELGLAESKANAQIRLFGATVTSWKASDGHERLFVSSKASLDGSAPIRGGIPLVFPVFGSAKDHEGAPAVMNKLASHGFARNHTWSICHTSAQVDQRDQVAVTLQLKTSDRSDIKALWPYDVLLKYTVTLQPNSLVCHLSIQHLETSAHQEMPFQALLHNYFLVPNSTKATVSGLQGAFYIDKVANKEEGQQLEPEILIDGASFDRVHVGKTKSSHESNQGSQDVVLKYNASLLEDPLRKMKKGVEIKRTATLRDTTVWNPAEGEAKIKDLAEGSWKHFVCVEPGAVHGFQVVTKGETWEAEQTLTVF